ncbi:MAG TPA: nucleotide exchange factor GrpE [Candidatus Paceibacterota bacterium]
MKDEDDIVIDNSTGGDDGYGVKDAERSLARLREKLKNCEAERQEYLTGWQRAKADFVNARKEEESQRANFIKFAEKKILLEFLSIEDSFNRAFQDRGAWEKIDKNWREGIEYLHAQFMDILKSHGIEPIESVGRLFNPQEHESLEEIELDNGEKEGMVIEEVRRGYKLHGSLLRPSQVKVAKRKSE